jgi:thiol-disulfide isomerase/thioredoxin
MDVSLPNRPMKRTLWGALEGAALGGLIYLGARVAASAGAGLFLRDALFFVVVGMIVCAAGQYLARGILGACIGLIAGLLLGSGFADEFARPKLAKHHLNQPAKLSGITLQGKLFEITSRRGNVVLVDFWATWCAPCRAELPGIKALHKRYHDEGLEIVGVSLDNSRDTLTAFVEEKKIPWPQIFTDAPGSQGWENPLIHEYTIDAIPYTLLVDREGKIVASGLIGSSLEDAVAKVMAGEKPARALMTGMDEPITRYFAVFGWLIGMLVERRLRQVGWGSKRETAP